MLVVAVVWALARPQALPSAGAAPGSSASAGPSTSQAATADETVPLDQVQPGPMMVTLELTDKRWGTAITVICNYNESESDTVTYDLAIVDTDGNQSSAGSWSSVPGVTARVPVATAVPRDRISSFEVRLTDGRTVLRGVP